MFKKILVAAASGMIAASAFAATNDKVEKSIQLKDGSTVHVFADGKMGMENRFGRAAYMEPGHAMQAKDGKTITMVGNEVWRVDGFLHRNITELAR